MRLPSPSLYAASPSPPRPRVVPIKFRRKSLNASEVDPDEARLSVYPAPSPPSTYASSPPPSAYGPYAYYSSNDYSSGSSSPIASSVALGSMPSSPVENPHIRYDSSPIREPSHYAIRHPFPGEEIGRYGNSHGSLLGLDNIQNGVPSGKTKPLLTTGHNPRAYAYAQAHDGPLCASDFEMGRTDYTGPIDDSEEDADMDVDFMSLPRRISFSTSCERDKPFVPSRPMLVTRTARSCPPIYDLLNPSPMPMSRTMSSETETTSRFSTPSLSSTQSCDLPSSSRAPSSASYATIMSVSPSPTAAASCYSPEPAPPTRVKPSSSLYALLNPIDEPTSPESSIGPVHRPLVRGSEEEFLATRECKSEVIDDAILSIAASIEERGHADHMLPACSARPSSPLVPLTPSRPSTPLKRPASRSERVSSPLSQPYSPQCSSVLPRASSLLRRPLSPLDDLPPSSPFSSPVAIRARAARSLKSAFDSLSSPFSSPLSSPRLVSPLSSLPSSPVLQGLDVSDPIPVDDPETSNPFALDGNDTINVPDFEPSVQRAPSPALSRSRSLSLRPEAQGSSSKEKSASSPVSIDIAVDLKREEAPLSVELVATTSAPTRSKTRAKSKPHVAKDVEDKSTIARRVSPAPTHKRRKEGSVKKRPRVILSDDESDDEAPAPARNGAKSQAQAAPHVPAESSEKENDQILDAGAKQRNHIAEDKRPAAKKKRRAKEEKDDDGSALTITRQTSSSSLARKAASSDSKPAATHHAHAIQTCELDLPVLPLPLQEMQGMLIESLATSRASSLPASSLYTALMSSRPALKDYQSAGHEGSMEKNEWIGIIEGVLEAGLSSSGVFGKVQNTVKDTLDHQLEAQWFYVPEKDEDEERATLIRSMMPRPAKRNETKKSKQYYWRPLGKISRWDPEDDL